MSGHTPGPWRIVQEDGYWVVRAANYDAVCRLYAGGNGDLIAAAPDLLALLKLLRDDWFEPHYGLNDIGYAALLRDRIRAAIAKAEAL